MRRSLLTNVWISCLAVLFVGLDLQRTEAQQSYPGYDFGASPGRAQSLWTENPQIDTLKNSKSKSPLEQIKYASQALTHPVAPSARSNRNGYGANGVNPAHGTANPTFQNPSLGKTQGYGELAGHGFLRRGAGQVVGPVQAPIQGGVIYGDPGVAEIGQPIESLIQPVTPIGVPLESMAPQQGVPFESPVSEGVPVGSGPQVASPAVTAQSSINGVWSSGNFDTTGNYAVNQRYDYAGNFLAGSPGQLNGYSMPSAVGNSGNGVTTGTGLFFRWERLWVTIDPPSIGEVGDTSAEGVFISNGIAAPFFNSLSGDFIDDRPDWGDRVEFGFADAKKNCGWVASVINIDQAKQNILPGGSIQFSDPFGVLLGFSDGNEDGFDDDRDGDNVYGRSGRDLGTPDPINLGQFLPYFDGIPDEPAAQDNGDLVSFLPVFDELEVSNVLNISGLELTRFRSLGSRGRPFAHILLGVRYVDMDENFYFRGSGSFMDETTVETKVENFILGPQVGVGFCRSRGHWGMDGSVRALAGINRQRGRQTALLATNATDSMGAANAPLNLTPMASADSQKSTQFSPFFEVRGSFYYNLNNWLSVRAGYTGWYASGISRASGSIDYSIPTFGFDIDNSDDLLAHALTLGLQGNW